MRALTYEMVRDIQEMTEKTIKELGLKVDNEKEVYERMNQEVPQDEKGQRKMQRLIDLLGMIDEELSVVNFTFGFGSKVEPKPVPTGAIYDVSASGNTENE